MQVKIPIYSYLIGGGFFISPMLSSFLFIIYSLLKKENTSQSYIIFFLLLCLSLGLINSTKIPESDLINYYNYFLDAGNYSLVNYLLLYGKEPVYYVYNYLFFHLTGGNTQAFIVFTTLIGYWFFFIAIYKFLKALNAANEVIIFSIVIAAFFPQLFSLSAHLIRQFIAAGIVIYAIVKKIFYKETVWHWLLIAAFTHSTAWIFLPLVYFKTLQKKLGVVRMIAIFVVVGLVGAFLQIISIQIISLLGNNILTYVFIRLTQQTYVELDALPLLSGFLLGVLLLIALYFQYTKKACFIHPGITHFLNVFLCFFLVLLSFIGHSELFVRFFFYIYFFLPLIIPLVVFQQNRFYQYLRLLVMFAVFFYFFYKLEHGVWEYASFKEIATFNIYKLYI